MPERNLPGDLGQQKRDDTEMELTPEQEAAKRNFLKYLGLASGSVDSERSLSSGDIEQAVDIKKEFNLPEDFVEQSAKEKFLKCLAGGNDGAALAVKQIFGLPEEFIFTPEVQQAAKEGFLNELKRGFFNYAFEIKLKFNLSDELISTPEVQQALTEVFEEALMGHHVDDVSIYIKKFNLSEKFVEKVIKNFLIKYLTEKDSFDWRDLLKILEKLGFTLDDFSSDSDFQQTAIAVMVKKLKEGTEGNVGLAVEIKQEFNLPESEVQVAAKQGLIENLKNGDIFYAFNIRNAFNLSAEFVTSFEVQIAVKQGWIKVLKGHIDHDNIIDNILSVVDEFNLPGELISSPEVKAAAEESLIDKLKKGGAEAIVALKIKDSFSLTLPNLEVHTVAVQGIVNCLKEDEPNVDAIQEVKNKLSLDIKSQEILFYFPDVQQQLQKLKEYFPAFVEQVNKSFDLFVSFLQFRQNPENFYRTIKENLFLLRAVEQNPRFGSKLVIKYQEFDETSKENISFLFQVKKDILSFNSEISPESIEFRQEIQNRLKAYGKNPEVVKAVEEKGINFDQWLDYEEISYFNLDSGADTLAFSETVALPLERIKETISSYAHRVKEVLSQFRIDFEKYQVPSAESVETAKKIKQMESELAKAQTDGNEKKIQGITKGLEAMKKKDESQKTVALWNKLMGDVSAFDQLKNTIFEAQEKLVKAEEKLNELLSGKSPSGKDVADEKAKLGRAKEDLRGKFEVLDRRIEEFKKNLPELVASALGEGEIGKGRAVSLVQEIESSLAEQFNHYSTDRTTMANLFSERADTEKEKLDKHPMSIFVWARNPDIDLYQGNYSPCCVCIESEYHGAESPIADYITDLGIQIVNIWDENKNEPVTAAWCWLGEDENGEPALVVDNIEANTMFSSNFSQQLSKELFAYLIDYAKAVGVKKVVLGKAHNDLPSGSELMALPDGNQIYKKIGGANRPDGYYLEAEDNSVKVIWEKGVKKQTIREKKEPKIKFKDFKVADLSGKDSDNLLALEWQVYGEDLLQGQELIEDIKKGNGLEYSVIISGTNPKNKKEQQLGYIVAVEDKIDEDDPSIYLEDFAVVPDAQGQGVGWELLKEFVGKLKAKAAAKGEPILWDMHLREGSQKLLEKHHDDLVRLGLEVLEEAVVPDYYDDGVDALYKVYRINS